MRKDVTPRIMTDTLVQTRLPPDLAEWIQKKAAAEGEAQSSWLRRLVFREASRSHVEAWARRAAASDPQIAHNEQSHFIKTPLQGSPYMTSRPYNDDKFSALRQVVRGFDDYYKPAVAQKHQPGEDWLVPNQYFK
jgi:hypothetical protein